MTQLSYCKTCILPNTRPNLLLDDKGNCNGCASCDIYLMPLGYIHRMLICKHANWLNAFVVPVHVG